MVMMGRSFWDRNVVYSIKLHVVEEMGRGV